MYRTKNIPVSVRQHKKPTKLTLYLTRQTYLSPKIIASKNKTSEEIKKTFWSNRIASMIVKLGEQANRITH
jgi:hypothetical protein